MTTETKLISSVEGVCKQLGYDTVIDALKARWALSLVEGGADMKVAARTAGLEDIVEHVKEEHLEKVLRSLGKMAC